MRFRRSRKRREPTFWVRNVFDGPKASYSSTSVALPENSKGGTLDQLAVGSPTFSGIDERYTLRRLIWRVEPRATFNATAPASTSVGMTCLVLKTSSTGLTGFVASPTMLEVLNGGSSSVPSAVDILDIKSWQWGVVPSGLGFVINPAFDRYIDFDIRVGRKLEANESICALWFGYTLNNTWAAGSSGTVNATVWTSALYSRTMR